MRRAFGAALAIAALFGQVGTARAAQGEQSSMQWSSPPAMTIDPARGYTATLHTTAGDIVIELLPQDAPVTVNNFVFLAREGFYAGAPFHRVIPGFMVQTGDPTGTGRGGPGYRFDDEPVRRPYERGIVAMANAGPNTNGSQFFIVHGDRARGLPPNYTIFGRVVSGLEVVDAIATAPTIPDGRENSRPVDPVRIERVTIEER
jgi:cyclophilin family peptidyl-prolyl cis-trans isomerase